MENQQNQDKQSQAGQDPHQSEAQSQIQYPDQSDSNINPMDPVNQYDRPDNPLLRENPDPNAPPIYPFPRLFQGMTTKQRRQVEKQRELITHKMSGGPDPQDFSQLRQIYRKIGQDKIAPGYDYVNEQVKKKDDMMPIPSAMRNAEQDGPDFPNFIPGAKVTQNTVKKMYETHYKQNEIKAKKQAKQTLKDPKGGKDAKDTKDIKDGSSEVKHHNQIKDGKDFQRVKQIKNQQRGDETMVKMEGMNRQRMDLTSGNKQQQQLVNLFCHYQGDLLLIARALNRKSVSSVCRQLNPLITEAIRNLENVIIRRKIRRMAIRWADTELKRFRHKFYEIKDGKLYGCQKRVRLGPLYKLMKMKYDRSITITNQQANQLYQGCLDLNLAIDQDTKARTNWNTQSVVWTHAEIKFFCRLILKTNDYQAISNQLIKQFGGVKQKFAPSKLVVKLDSLLKGSLKKLKHLALQYEDLPTLCRVQGKDFRNICYGTHFQFNKVRKAIIEFFLASSPPKQQIGRILHIVNMFLQECRKFQENRSKKPKLQMNITDLKRQYTEEEVERLKIQKALAHPEYMRTPRDIYYSERNNIKYQDEDVSIIPKGNAQELQRRLREIKQMQRQRYLKLQQEKKLLENNNDRRPMKTPFNTYKNNIQRDVPVKKNSRMGGNNRFDSDSDGEARPQSRGDSKVKIDYDSMSNSKPNSKNTPGKNSGSRQLSQVSSLKKEYNQDSDDILGGPGSKKGMNSPGSAQIFNRPNINFDSDDSLDLNPKSNNSGKKASTPKLTSGRSNKSNASVNFDDSDQLQPQQPNYSAPKRGRPPKNAPKNMVQPPPRNLPIQMRKAPDLDDLSLDSDSDLGPATKYLQGGMRKGPGSQMGRMDHTDDDRMSQNFRSQIQDQLQNIQDLSFDENEKEIMDKLDLSQNQ